MVSHIVATAWSLNNAGVRSGLLRITVAFTAFVAGVLIGSVQRYVQQQLLAAQTEAPVPASVHEEMHPVYPETRGLTPWEIANFINDHPHANLDRLWQRLGVTDDADAPVQFNFSGKCGNCEANIFEYNLDNDVNLEVVLQIKQQFAEMYRYLIFNEARDLNPKLLGKIDVWAKYRPADPVLLMSNDQTWLIVQSTAGTGSGFGSWRDTVYEVSDSGVREIGSYLGAVHQGANEFIGRLVSCEIKNGRAILKVSYTIKYFSHGAHSFTKKKTIVLRAALGHKKTQSSEEEAQVIFSL